MTAVPRVLHVYKDYFPPVVGGVEKTINLLAHGTRGEFDVSVLVCSRGRDAREERADGVRVRLVPEWGRFASAPFSPAFPAALREEARNADILHFHHPNPTGDIACLLARVHKPAVITYHSDIVRQRFSRLLVAPVQEAMMRRARVIMPTSENYVRSSAWLRRFAGKCRVVPLGIDVDACDATDNVRARAASLRAGRTRPVIAFLGKLRYYKGLEFLVRAMCDVQADLWIIGSGGEELRLRSICSECGTDDRIHFLGELPADDVLCRLHAADIFCLPSHLRSEAFGLSQVEAMACGLPVVCCNLATGVPFVNQDGVTGIVVEPASPPALAAALNRLAGDEPLRQSMGQAARRRAREYFCAARMCADVMDVYRSVL